jgi:N-methylhydantoinase B
VGHGRRQGGRRRPHHRQSRHNHEHQLQPLSDGNILKRGDVLRIETGGGGGYGHPFDRPPESVLDDVLGGFVTQDAARAEYGVAIDGDTIDRTSPGSCGRSVLR